MNGFGHLLQVGTFLETGLAVRIDAIGALNRVRHGQGNERLFPLRQGSFRKDGTVPVEEFIPELRALLPDLRELQKIAAVIIMFHCGSFR